MSVIYLIRHAQASFGERDYDRLSELGSEQARILGQSFTPLETADTVVTGNMLRHKQTMQLSLPDRAHTLDDTVARMDPGFDEFNHQDIVNKYSFDLGNFDSLSDYISAQDEPKKTFHRIFVSAMKQWMEGRHDELYQESWPNFKMRVQSAFSDTLKHSGRGKTTVIFTSGGPISCICQSIMRLEDDVSFSLNENLANGSITKILTDGNRASLAYFNNYHYLERAGSRLVTFR